MGLELLERTVRDFTGKCEIADFLFLRRNCREVRIRERTYWLIKSNNVPDSAAGDIIAYY